jgi:ABC-type branched-subunit amino acid transport system substrate-binding protein
VLVKAQWRLILASATAVALLLAAVATAGVRNGSHAGSQGQTQQLVIGNLLELTGVAAFLGPPFEKAGEVGQKAVTDAIAKAKIPLSVKVAAADTQADAQAAVLAARSLVNKGATCLIGPASTFESLAIANSVSRQRHIVLFPQATGTTSDIRDGRTVLRPVPSAQATGVAAARAANLLLHGATGKTVSLAAFNEPYGTDLVKFFSMTWRAMGGKVTGPVIFDPKATSLDSEAGKIVKGDPDAYWIIGDPDVFGRLVQALLRTGEFKPNRLILPDLLAFPVVPKNIPKQALEGGHALSVQIPTNTPAYRAYAKLRKSVGGGAQLPFDPVITDSVVACALAAASAHSTKPAALMAKVLRIANPPGATYGFTSLAAAFKAAWAGKDINYQGISSTFDFTATGDAGQSQFQVGAYKQGRLVPGPTVRS